MKSYHHGDLRRRLLELAANIANTHGIEAITLRELARQAEVSHSAPIHHFHNRQGLLAALATEGFASLSKKLDAHEGDIYAMGVAYVLWALDHPGTYAVMWQPHDAHPEVAAASRRTWEQLTNGVGGGQADAYAAFAVVHGLATLWLSGVLPQPENPAATAEEVTRRIHFGA